MNLFRCFKEATLFEKFLFLPRLVLFGAMHVLAFAICLLTLVGWGFEEASDMWNYIVVGR